MASNTQEYNLEPNQSLEDYFVLNPKKCIDAVNKNGMMLKHIKNQTPYICTRAVKQCGAALAYVIDQTSLNYLKICLVAVKNFPWSLRHVSEMNLTIDDYTLLCIEAVKRDGLSLRYGNLYPSNQTK